MDAFYDGIGKLLGGFALLMSSVSMLLWKRHGARCEEVQKEKVSREEFNNTVQSIRDEMTRIAESSRADMFNNIESLRKEIRDGYQHIEIRIDNATGDTHKRIDRLLERRENGRNGLG